MINQGKNKDTINYREIIHTASKDAEKKDHSHMVGENIKWYRHFGKQFGHFL